LPTEEAIDARFQPRALVVHCRYAARNVGKGRVCGVISAKATHFVLGFPELSVYGLKREF
jgi:hypothetical protein